MVRTQIYLPEELHQELRGMSRRMGLSMAQLLREGAEKVVKERKTTKAKVVKLALKLPSFKGGKPIKYPLNREQIYAGRFDRY